MFIGEKLYTFILKRQDPEKATATLAQFTLATEETECYIDCRQLLYPLPASVATGGAARSFVSYWTRVLRFIITSAF